MGKALQNYMGDLQVFWECYTSRKTTRKEETGQMKEGFDLPHFNNSVKDTVKKMKMTSHRLGENIVKTDI